MKIAMVSERADARVAALARAVRARGEDVAVHLRHDGADAPRPAASDGAGVAHLGDFARDLMSAWEDERPDVVHAHFWTAGWASLAATRALRIPLVLTYDSLAAVERRHLPGVVIPYERDGIERYLAGAADRIVATSEEVARELVAQGVRRAAVAVVPSGVDLETFQPMGSAEPRRDGLARVVLAGGPVARDGIGDVLGALTAVPDAELVVAAGPPAADPRSAPAAQRLLAAADRAGVADRVVYRGLVERGERAALLRSADVLVCVPWYAPAAPMLLEAMACGVPVVASAVGSLADTVVDGHTGVLVPPRDPARLARALRAVLSDEVRRAGLGFAAYDRARARYGWDRIAEETVSLYASVAAAPAEALAN